MATLPQHHPYDVHSMDNVMSADVHLSGTYAYGMDITIPIPLTSFCPCCVRLRDCAKPQTENQQQAQRRGDDMNQLIPDALAVKIDEHHRQAQQHVQEAISQAKTEELSYSRVRRVGRVTTR